MDLTKYYPDIAAKYPAYVTQRELCEICRICPKTAYNLEQQGEIPYTIEQNHLIRSHKIKLTDILAYLYRRECRQEADSPYICAIWNLQRRCWQMPKINPRIKSIDDLLGLDAAEERPIEPTPSVSLPTKNTIIALPPQAIRAFRGHPFRLYEGDRLNDLVESISEHGVLNPVIIRKIERDEDGFEYEMLAGHNRQNAAAIANRELPCIVKENLSDEDAWIYVIETNVLQRSFSEMLPSEKAAVLALRYSKMICQGRRNDIVEELKRLENPDEIRETGTCGIECHKSKSRDVVGAEYLPFGGWNECPNTPELMAVAKYWFEQHGAVPAAMSHDELEFLLPAPVPEEKAMDAAVELYGFCPDVIDQGPEDATVGALADVLRQSTVWYFWWD